MRIKLNRLAAPMAIDITGEEAWLAKIYETFDESDTASEAKLKATLVAKQAHAGTSIAVAGKAQFAPQVACSRCGELVRFPMDFEIDAVYKPEPSQESRKVHNLSSDELDEYYLQDAEADLEVLLTDAINAQLPERVYCTALLCNQESDDQDAGQENAKEASPFAVLAGMKDRLGDPN